MHSGRQNRGTAFYSFLGERQPRLERRYQTFDVISMMNGLDRRIRTHKHKETFCILPPGIGRDFVVFYGLLHICGPHFIRRIFLDCIGRGGKKAPRSVSRCTTFTSRGDPMRKRPLLRLLDHFLLSQLVTCILYGGEEVTGVTERVLSTQSVKYVDGD